MDGVTILQTIPQYKLSWGWGFPATIFSIISFAMLVAIIVHFVRGDRTGAFVFLIGLLSAGAITIGVARTSGEKFTHNQYQVLIDKSVSITDFTEKYNVIEQQGITYIVEEKVTE